ncbi:hypothetical protein [Georgenia sp. SYP-B2076]|uniref:acyltransferase n=1 Tax=Georgenia sp. SYP-B2076 TaxID=2495881 RepID=UPI000F8EBF5E|nr:hypothetical protein [Georgenia sp. SYP-B2076]
MSRLRDVVLLIVWLLPASGAKNAMLRAVGHRVHATARARCSLVWRARTVEMGPGSRIGRFNVVKNVRLLRLGREASIGRMNLISAHPVYGRLYPSGASMTLGDHSYLTSRHSVDCSGPVTIGDFAAVAGHRTTILTHSVDVRTDAQLAHPVTIGPRSFVSTNCLIVGGAELPSSSLLAAGAVLARARTGGEPGLWAGVPARRVGEVEGSWFARAETHTHRVFVPETGETVEKAF